MSGSGEVTTAAADGSLTVRAAGPPIGAEDQVSETLELLVSDYPHGPGGSHGGGCDIISCPRANQEECPWICS